MPDICMCDGLQADKSDEVVCPHRDECYRHTAKPSEWRQSYFMIAPLDVETKRCEYFMRNKTS